MKYHFYISLRTQYENLGDYLIAQATIDILKNLGNITLDINKVPDNYLDLLVLPKNVKLVNSGLIKTIIKNKKQKWIYVVKPGGYKTSDTIKQKVKLVLMYFYFLLGKIFFNVKLIKMPHSYLGKLSIYDKLYQQLFDLIMVRDDMSLENYKKCKVKKLLLLEDLATYYIEEDSKFLSKKEVERNNITISLRYDRKNNEENISYNIAKIILDNENLNEILYIAQVTFDNELNKTIALQNKKKYITYNVSNESIKKIINIYKSSKYVISNRLHALLLAKINGAIPIAIVDIQKDKKIIASLNLLKIYWLDKNTINEEKLEFFLFSMKEHSVSKYNINYEKIIQNSFNNNDI